MNDFPFQADGESVGSFFDCLTEDYTATIERCFPRYREMLWALLAYLPEQRDVRQIVELGCGTGNLTVLLTERFPDAQLHVVDLSKDSLDICRQRLPASVSAELSQQDFRELDFEAQSVDLVISSIAVHHLTGAEKQMLFANACRWLSTGGVFAMADQCCGATSELSAKHTAFWHQLTMEAGSTDQQWEMWMQHQAEHDHHDTLGDQLNWLSAAGFTTVDCAWRYLLWSVIQARK